eukprot:CAMPEP_0168324120 /NCGR_PEP_ID=MMETSP0213-20121227/3893_1 /TAXON_ID=151035 /ORGANISM="Euplotes harpa, Strain FSP1.4" /LENGTH=137 /DNA_ID=CAMNT_0008326333 /DNA_START=282 /DNA_END=695 /DNA_ORIENTATION=-
MEDVNDALEKKYSQTQINVSTAPMCLEAFSPKLSEFLHAFNNTSEYEDKAKEAFDRLNEVKDVLLDDMEKLLDRDKKLDIALAKSKLLTQESQTFRKHSRQFNNKTKMRKFCYSFWTVMFIVLVLAAIVLVLCLLVF